MNRTIAPDGLVLSAGALRLRPTAADDRAGVIAAGQAPGIGGKMPWFPSPFPDHYADGWIERAASEWRAGRHFVLSVIEAESGAYVGSVVLSVVADDALELAYWILPAWEGKGAATAAAIAAVDWARTAIGPARIVAKTRPGAAASQRVLAKAGFAATGTEGQSTFELKLG